MNRHPYSIEQVSKGLTNALNHYLEAQYHIWDDHLLEERTRLLDTLGITHQAPYLEATPAYAIGNTFAELEIPQPVRDILTFASTVKNSGIYRSPYLHQSQALEEFFKGEDDLIVATGTGSGKTESFLMPILGTLAMEANASNAANSTPLPGARALLLYPMNALVNDQISRLRRLVGSPEIAENLRQKFGRTIRFGMYTGRTPYPGKETDAKNEERLKNLIEKLFEDLTPETRRLLEREGKWPSKDMSAYIANGFKTGANDSELYSRQEMQFRCPDLLVTNYSMLEYMLLRPIERSIFQQTKEWLHSSGNNQLTVVIDEAHMYRGAVGAEVAMLLRRLQSRLEVGREKFRYILTSASLGNSDDAKREIKRFAADLTGLCGTNRGFSIITGTRESVPVSRDPSTREISALAEFPADCLHELSSEFGHAVQECNKLFSSLDFPPLDTNADLQNLRDAVFKFLRSLGPAGKLTDLITSAPKSFAEVKVALNVESENGTKALESLIALCTFAQRSDDDRVYLPIRAHLFFRGFSAIHTCVNPNCSERSATSGMSILGRLFEGPRLTCNCGARVYELLTHRDCGAAFLRGFFKDKNGHFVWHEQSSSIATDGGSLIPVEFLVETNRDRDDPPQGSEVWLHIYSGQIQRNRPQSIEQFLKLTQPRLNDTTHAHSFESCPVCLRGWAKGNSKIMDLATKGEAPFAHLIKSQVQMQPATKERSAQFPNAGRKSLIFSDGRQKAARLARDIPRETERDVFRQLICLAIKELDSIRTPSSLGLNLFVAFVHVVSKHNVVLFDGMNQSELLRIVNNYRSDFGINGDISGAIVQGMEPTLQYWASLLRQIGPGHYTLPALTLAYIEPNAAAQKKIRELLPNISQNDLDALVNIWIQSLLNRYAFNPALSPGVRIGAGGYGTENATKGFYSKDKKLLSKYFPNIDEIEKALQDSMATSSGPGIFLRPERLRFRLAVDREWIRCLDCASVAPFSMRSHCSNCGSENIQSSSANHSDYLRARKTFWRDPVIDVLEQHIEPLNLSVEEHTAQLGYRDVDDPTSTTEEFERRFRDITKPAELPVDVLSSTTTMEVGIDIGSLVAVALRNVPPMRQNYQQRAGRTGRRGSAVSTVITYAQNSPHDNHYFENPTQIIAGDPPLPAIDVENVKIVSRHVHAALIQRFFHEHLTGANQSNDIFSTLGSTWDFYDKHDQNFSLNRFTDWLTDPVRDSDTYSEINRWIPDGVNLDSRNVGVNLIDRLIENRPENEDYLAGNQKKLIEFLFDRGLLPAYAFPRDLCALQIEIKGSAKIEERPQQGLAVALTEYAPGRLVVVNKKTYRIGSVAASAISTVPDRARPLFSSMKHYLACPECSFTQPMTQEDQPPSNCPMCAGNKIFVMDVIQPEVVYPEGQKEVNELDDEQVITHSSPAQFPVVSQNETFDWLPRFANANVAAAQNQQLVMVNVGQPGEDRPNGFWVCSSCGKTSLDGEQIGNAHERDYHIQVYKARQPGKCRGTQQNVFLGYSFSTDVMLMRISLVKPIVTNVTNRVVRRPLESALSSLVEAISLAAANVLDIDPRELSGGHRFIKVGDQTFADLFLFDNLSGGAGYAHMAAKDIMEILGRAERRLSNCECDQSCTKCLRHYGNRFKHSSLDRFLALELLRYVKSGFAPSIESIEVQRRLLEPLRYTLQFEGWIVEQIENVPLAMSKANQSLRLGVYPALLDPATIDKKKIGIEQMISAFDLKFDLPGVFAMTGH